MNGKAAKALRRLRTTSHKDKKMFSNLAQHEKYILRKEAEAMQKGIQEKK